MYDHKHQPLSADDATKGLLKMAIDIAEVLLRSLASEGVVFTEGLLKTVALQHARSAEDTIDRYEADAAINRLPYDRHGEETMAAVFGRGLEVACERYWNGAATVPTIPSWNRVQSAIPGFLDLLREAVEEDSAATAAA